MNRDFYAVNKAAELGIPGCLMDMNGDCLPELVTAYGNDTFMDTECTVYSLDDDEQIIDTFYADFTSTLRKYYDSAKDEYFCISECRFYGMAGTTSSEVRKTVFHHNSCSSEVIASEEYFYDYEDGNERIYLADSSFMGKRVDGGRFVEDPDMRAYRDALEKYLSDYELVEELAVSEVLRAHENEDIQSEYRGRLDEFRSAFFSDPEAAIRQYEDKTIPFDGNRIDRDVTLLEINMDTFADASDFARISEFKNLERLDIYAFETENMTLDLDLIDGCFDKVTDINVHNVKIDPTKLKNFKRLEKLSVTGGNIDYTKLDGLTNLKSLSLNLDNYEGEAADLSALSSLTGLEWLSVDGKITNCDFTENMKSLEQVYFTTECNEKDCFEALSKLSNLSVFIISGHSAYPSNEQLECFEDRDDIVFPVIK